MTQVNVKVVLHPNGTFVWDINDSRVDEATQEDIVSNVGHLIWDEILSHINAHQPAPGPFHCSVRI